MTPPHASSPAPFSVVICTKDRPDDLARCLDSLSRQTRMPEEVVVVDASATTVESVVDEFRAKVGDATVVKLLRTEPGLTRQRNLGVAATAGSVVLFLDDDTVLDPDYVKELGSVFEEDRQGSIGGVGGTIVPDTTPRESALRRAVRRMFLLPGYGGGRIKRSGYAEFALSPRVRMEVEFLSGCNMSFRREVLETLRFDERLSGYALGEDVEFSYRVSRSWRLVLTPDARLEHREAEGGRPLGGARAEMAVRNHFAFFREQVARTPADWLFYIWAELGNLLWTLRHPGEGRLRGFLRGQVRSFRQLIGERRRHGGAEMGGESSATCVGAEHARLAAGDRPRGSQTPALPFVSVVVPARNEERFLGPCLDSLLAQTYPQERTEILVIENRSTDRTGEVASAYAARDARIRILTCDGPNQAAGMNAGILAARGSIVARVDAHGYVARDYLEKTVAIFARSPGVVAVGGPYLPGGERLLERVAGLARASRIGVGGGWYSDAGTAEHSVRTVGCPAYLREALLAVGMFDPAMVYAEDDELNWRLIKRGGKILYCPSLHQYNYPRGTLRELFRQYWNYGQGRMRVLLKHPDFLLPRHLIPSAFIGALGACATMALVSSLGRALLVVVVGVYAVALSAAGLSARASGWREAALVPLAVGLMHMAYGAGMLCGAARHVVARFRRAPEPREGRQWQCTIESPHEP